MLNKYLKIISLIMITMFLFYKPSFAIEEENALNENTLSTIETTDGALTNPQNSIKENDVYLVDENVTIDYYVSGNVFICANTVTINSQIDGDVFICANTIKIEKDSYIFKNLFALANTLNINGVVYDVYACAKDFNLSDGYIYRDLKLGCENFNMSGLVGRDVFLDASNIYLNHNESIQNNSAQIGRNFNYSSKTETIIPEGYVVGSTNYKPNVSVNTEESITEKIHNYFIKIISFVILSLFVWLICKKLSPKFYENSDNYIGKKLFPAIGFGFIFLITLPLICLFLIILNITSVISWILIFLYIISIIISKPLFATVANNYICKKYNINKTSNVCLALVATSIVFDLIFFVPIVGKLLSFISIISGIGIIVHYCFFNEQPENNKVEGKQ